MRFRRGFPEGRPLTGGWRDDPGWPDVDVVMPIRNEFEHLEAAIESVRAQEYPGRMRIFLGVGPSDDGTEALAERLAADADDLTVVANPSGTIPAGLNLAIDAGGAPVVVRVDGHSRLSDGYVRRAVETLRETGAANVGGRQVPMGSTPFENAVAAVTTSWVGTGGAGYRVGGATGPTDTVFLGVYDRWTLEDIGRYDETLLANEDYELNIRLRQAGGLVWFDPSLAVEYRPRGSFGAVAQQYFNYGRWKAVVLRRHPGSLRLRQLVPPMAIGAVVVAAVLGSRWRRLWVVPVGYVTVVAGALRRPSAVLAAITVHISWAAGLLGQSTRSFRQRLQSRASTDSA